MGDTFEIKDIEAKKEKVQLEKGLVTPYDVGNKLIYPHILLKADKMPKYIADLLSRTLMKNKMLEEGIPDNSYQVYLSRPGMKISLGYLTGTMLKTFLGNPVYAEYEKEMYIKEIGVEGIEKTIKIEGDLMYSMGTSSIL